MSLESTISVKIGFSIKRRPAAERSRKLVLISLLVLDSLLVLVFVGLSCVILFIP